MNDEDLQDTFKFIDNYVEENRLSPIIFEIHLEAKKILEHLGDRELTNWNRRRLLEFLKKFYEIEIQSWKQHPVVSVDSSWFVLSVLSLAFFGVSLWTIAIVLLSLYLAVYLFVTNLQKKDRDITNILLFVNWILLAEAS